MEACGLQSTTVLNKTHLKPCFCFQMPFKCWHCSSLFYHSECITAIWHIKNECETIRMPYFSLYYHSVLSSFYRELLLISTSSGIALHCRSISCLSPGLWLASCVGKKNKNSLIINLLVFMEAFLCVTLLAFFVILVASPDGREVVFHHESSMWALLC